MTVRLLISVRPGETLGALVEDGRMTWFDFIRTLQEDTPPPTGSVFLARVRRVEKGLQAAFVELTAGGSAMLTAKDARILAADETARPAVEKLVHEGEAVLVQISRPARDGKGPRVTADIALPGKDGNPIYPRRGGQTPLWSEIRESARSARPPALLWQPPRPDPAVALWQSAPVRPDAVEVDHEPSAATLRRILTRTGSGAAVTVCREDAFAAHGLDQEVERLSAPAVALKGGGTLIIEPTAALTAVDVNAGGAIGSTTEDTALKVNLVAAREVARQIALRRLGGIVVIDFLRLKAARHRREIVLMLRDALETHRLNVPVADFSAAGLVELVVPHRGASLQEGTGVPCRACGGSGRIPDTGSRALALLARIAREARRGGAPSLEARAAPDVIAWINARADAVTRELERLAVTAVSWRPEPGWPPERIDVRPRPN